MNKIFKLIGLLFCNVFMLVFNSCGTGDDVAPDGGNDNERMVGTKWIYKNGDISVGDDYITFMREGFVIYFYSETEGVIYYYRREFDSDTGSTHPRVPYFFDYSLIDRKLEINGLTYTDDIMPSYCTVKGDFLETNIGLNFEKHQMERGDYSFIESITGTTGDLKWYMDLNGGVWILGTGRMNDYKSYQETPWCSKYEPINYVEIGDEVNHIGSYAFATPSVGGVDIYGGSLKSIGAYAFSGASIAKFGYRGQTVETIEDGAFSGCSYLTDSPIGGMTTEIGDYAFSDCKKLQLSLSSCDKLRKIGNYAFMGVKEIRDFSDLKSLEEIGNGALIGCSFKEIKLPQTVKKLGHLCFEGSFSTIRVNAGLESVSGTPFFPSVSGAMYVDKNKPMNLFKDIIDSEVIHKWRLYVPAGSRKAYMNAEYWRDFGEILEDSSLYGDGTDPGNWDQYDDEGIPLFYDKSINYVCQGNTFRTVKVEGQGSIKPFYIMQTEMPLNNGSILVNGKSYSVAIRGGYVVIKAEFRIFLEQLRKDTQIPFRLPSEEEWLLAAKGGDVENKLKYSGSNNLDDVGWYNGNCNGVQPFARKRPNSLGLYDMSGNYWELCEQAKGNVYGIDGPSYGGSWKENMNSCTVNSRKNGVQSGNVSGTSYKEKNAFDGRYISFRLVYSAE